MATSRKKTRPLRKDRFESVAQRLECDDDKAAFEAKLGKIAKGAPDKNQAPKRK